MTTEQDEILNIAASLIMVLKAKMVLLVQIPYLVTPNKYISPLPHNHWDGILWGNFVYIKFTVK